MPNVRLDCRRRGSGRPAVSEVATEFTIGHLAARVVQSDVEDPLGFGGTSVPADVRNIRARPAHGRYLLAGLPSCVQPTQDARIPNPSVGKGRAGSVDAEHSRRLVLSRRSSFRLPRQRDCLGGVYRDARTLPSGRLSSPRQSATARTTAKSVVFAHSTFRSW
jgi:hypothetical protein